MPRIAGATKRKAPSKKTAKPKKYYSILLDEQKFITQEKIDILNHHATKTVWIGAKDSGKTRPVVYRQEGEMEEDDEIAHVSLKAFKTAASETLFKEIQKAQFQIKAAGFASKEFRLSINKAVKQVKKSNGNNNPTIIFGSFEGYDDLAGLTPPGNRRFSMVHIEEPVNMGKQSPSRKEWTSQLSAIMDTIDRANRDYISNNHDKIVATGKVINPVKYHLTMNAWDRDHPEVEDAERYLPEREFIEWVIGIDWDSIDRKTIMENWDKIWARIKTHHTMTRYIKKNDDGEYIDTLYVRLTKLANPQFHKDWWGDKWDNLSDKMKDQITSIERDIKNAIINKDSYSLAANLGLSFEGTNDNDMTYNVRRFDTCTIEEMRENNVSCVGLSMAFDIDVNEQLTLSTTLLVKQSLLFDKPRYGLYKYPVKIIKAFGVGDVVNNNNYYIKRMVDAVIETRNTVVKDWNVTNFRFGQYVYFDDDKKIYINSMEQELNAYGLGVFRAKKHGEWGIMQRQDFTQVGLDNGFIINHPDNEILKLRLAACINTVGTRKRNTNTRKNKLHIIDSDEYSNYPFRAFINTKKYIIIKSETKGEKYGK